jgi:hypothetical protein
LAAEQEPVVAVGLLTQTHLNVLGTSLKQVFPIPEDTRFDDLLNALDNLGRTGDA